MAQTYATYEDVEKLFGPVANTTQVDALLDAAYVKVLAKVPDLENRVLNQSVSPDLVTLVLVEMVQAVLRNPSGQKSGSEWAGPFGKVFTPDPVAASGMLRVTDEHLEMLTGVVHGSYTVPARDDGLPTVSWPMRRHEDHWHPVGDW